MNFFAMPTLKNERACLRLPSSIRPRFSSKLMLARLRIGIENVGALLRSAAVMTVSAMPMSFFSTTPFVFAFFLAMIVSSVTKFLLLFWKYRLNLRVHLFNPFVLSLSKDSLINLLLFLRARLIEPEAHLLRRRGRDFGRILFVRHLRLRCFFHLGLVLESLRRFAELNVDQFFLLRRLRRFLGRRGLGALVAGKLRRVALDALGSDDDRVGEALGGLFLP